MSWVTEVDGAEIVTHARPPSANAGRSWQQAPRRVGNICLARHVGARSSARSQRDRKSLTMPTADPTTAPTTAHSKGNTSRTSSYSY